MAMTINTGISANHPRSNPPYAYCGGVQETERRKRQIDTSRLRPTPEKQKTPAVRKRRRK